MAYRRNAFDFGYLAKALEEARTAAGFNAFEYDEVASVLISAADWRSSIPLGEHKNLVRAAIEKAAAHRPITAKGLQDGIAQVQDSFLALPRRGYWLVTTLSLATAHLPSESRFGDVRLCRRLPPAYLKARSSEAARVPAEYQQPRGWTWARVQVTARTADEAAERGLDDLDFVRGCWNLYLNRKVYRKVSFPSDVSPINKIRLGPSHTLHDGKGGLAGEGHWGDWLPPAERLFTASSATWDAFCNFYQNTARRLRHHPYGHALRRPIIRYTRALDSQDDDGSLLKLWTLAETLTNSGGSNYDVTIRRIASLFEARDLTRHVLEHLRFQRNDSAHGGEIRDDPRVLVYQVKGYIEALLDFHFGTGRMLESIEEAAQFMDLPVNLQTLKRRIFLHRKAIRFRS